MAVNRDLGLSFPEMTAMAAASAGMAPRLSATSSAIFMNLSAAAADTESRDLSASTTISHYDDTIIARNTDTVVQGNGSDHPNSVGQLNVPIRIDFIKLQQNWIKEII